MSAFWSIVSGPFCKVKILDLGTTREHVTLDYLHNKRLLGFAIPEHKEYDGGYYVILSRLTGQTLSQAWPNMNEAIKQHYISHVVNICSELAVWQADIIGGIECWYLSESYLTQLGQPKDFSPRNLLDNCC